MTRDDVRDRLLITMSVALEALFILLVKDRWRKEVEEMQEQLKALRARLREHLGK